MTRSKTCPRSLAKTRIVARSRYHVVTTYPGYIVRGPGVKVRVFNEVIDIALVIRHALDQAFQAGRKSR